MNTKSFIDVATLDAKEAMEMSRHNFKARTAPALWEHQDGIFEIPDKKVVYNSATGAYLGTVGQGYKIIQPETFYDLAQRFIDETGAQITRTISMNYGAVIGINFLMDTKEYLTGDPVEMNFLMMTAFNGRYSLLGRALSTRLFCLNQLPSSTKLFDIKHTTYALNRVEIALKMIRFFSKEQGHFDAKMRNLTNYRMDEAAQLDWFNNLFPLPAPGSKRANTIAINRSKTFMDLLNTGKGTEVPGIKGTAYQALNALTEYVNHYRPTRVSKERDQEEVKFEAVIFGSGNNLMQRGFDTLVKKVNNLKAQDFWRK